MSDAPSTGEWAGIIAAIGAVAAMCGKGLTWLGGFFERSRESRAAKLQAWHDELQERETRIDAAVEDRLAILEERDATRGEETMALRMAFELVASALRAIDPKNTALSRAEQLLQAAFPLAPIVPADMSTTLIAVDIKDRAAVAAQRVGATPA